MNPHDDASLLRLYAEARSQDAFAALVRRYIDLVYSTAMRCVGGDAHLAQDVAQEVFVLTARRAGSLVRYPALEGWLYTTTRYEAIHAVRREQRRRSREQKAHTMNELHLDSSPEPEWHRLRPLLDDAMGELNEQDRDAVVLRFLLRRPLREVGAKLGLNEDTARRRVDRALEKLHRLLARRGITSTTAAIAGLLTQAVSAAPAHLATQVTGVAFGASPGIASATLNSLHFMNTSKLVAGCAVALVIAAAGTAIYESTTVRRIASELSIAHQEMGLARSQLAELQEREKSLQARRARPSEALAIHAVAASTQTKPKPRPSASKPPIKDKTPEVIAGDKFLAEHPEALALWDAREKAGLGAKMAPIYRRLGLSPDQTTAFEELVLQNQTRNTGINSPDGLLMLHAEPKISPQEFEDRARALLGDSGWEQMQQFARTAPAYDLTAKLAGAVYRSDPLAADQIDQIALILADASSSFQRGRAVDRSTIDWNAALVAGRSVLSPGQLAALANLRRQTEYQQTAQKITFPSR